MFSRKIFTLIACSLILIGISSCATNKESVSQPVENPSGLSEMPFKAGETVMIYTKSKISISSWDVDMVQMFITDVNATRIMGEVDWVCCDHENGKEDVVGEIVEINIDNIAKIWLSEKQVQAVGETNSGDKAGEFAVDTILGVILYPIGLAIFLALFIAII